MKTFSGCAPKTPPWPRQARAAALAHTRSAWSSQFFAAEAVGRQRVDRAVDVAEVVVEDRPDDTLRAACATRMSPMRLRAWYQLPATSRAASGVLQLQDGQRLAGLGVAERILSAVGHLLQRALDLVGDLLGHLLRAGAGPEGLHHHGAEGERRILVLPQLEVGRKAQQPAAPPSGSASAPDARAPSARSAATSPSCCFDRAARRRSAPAAVSPRRAAVV